MEAVDIIRQSQLIAVINMENTSREDLLPKLGALLSGGLNAALLDFSHGFNPDLMRAAAVTFPDMLIGASGLCRGAEANHAISSGARFIATPGWSGDISDVCREDDILYIPGCATPTEIMTALLHGSSIVKLFPAQMLGGVEYVKALSDAFPHISIIPSGGIDETNIGDYLSCRAVIACESSHLTDKKVSLDEIAKGTAELVERFKAKKRLDLD